MLKRLVDRRTAEATDRPGSVAVTSRSTDDQATAGIVEGSGTTRRAMIVRGLWAVAGAVGLGVAGTGANFAATKPVAPPAGPARLSLVVRDVRFSAPASKPGTLPESDAVASPHGALQDATGRHLGRFSGGTLPGSGGQIAVQRFTFSDGTIIGMGSGRLDGDEYAVVGGTGRYAGATGTYVAQLRPGARGRDAEFQISVTGTRG